MPEKPAPDRESFQQLLEAAYVLQEHSAESPAAGARPDYAQVLSELVEVQSLIYSPELDLHSAATLIASRALKFTRADGAAVGVLKDDELLYKSATGSAADDRGMPVPLASSLSGHCFASGQTIQSLDTLKDRRIPSELCREGRVRSLIAAPASYEGKVAGVLELRFTERNAFQEQDVRTCQLMAGLLAQAIARSAELEWKQAMAAERATMIETLAKIKPQLERMTEESAKSVDPVSPAAEPLPAPPAVPAVVNCRSCGHQLEKEESYCGLCGTPRPSLTAGGGDLQSKWASLWHLKQASAIRKGESWDERAAESAEADSPMKPVEGGVPGPTLPEALTTERPTVRILPATSEANEGGAAAPVAVSPWTSASRARGWLESFNTPRKRIWLSRHRANLYLATAAALLFAVIAGWGSHPTPVSGNSASGRRNPPPPPLSLFEKALVGLGLAVPPPAPAYKGNPSVTVWEDERTALYYCPGADLYGKTEKGKFSTQKDAQQDQFEPAFRRPCE